MWRATAWFVALALGCYTVALLCVEWFTSQEYARHYFTDLTGPVDLWGINTTLSVFLLAATALLLVFAAATLREAPAAAGARRLFLSQAPVFAFLAFDDRFQFHEKLSFKLGIGDHWILGAIALLEVALLAIFARPHLLTRRAVAFFVAAVALFSVMMVFDVLVPHEMVLRLSAEDLAKSWSAAAFLACAWTVAADQLRLHLRPS